MAKTDESWYSSGLDVTRIRQVLGQALAGAEISQLGSGPLDEPAALKILASKNPGMFNRAGSATIGILVFEQGDHRRIQLVAFGTSLGENMSGQWQMRGASFGAQTKANREKPDLGKGKKMVAECVSALQSADPQFKRVG
ncbi:MAG: hypothetical protein QM753_00820 [Thermomicrobiales bacterium]